MSETLIRERMLAVLPTLRAAIELSRQRKQSDETIVLGVGSRGRRGGQMQCFFNADEFITDLEQLFGITPPTGEALDDAITEFVMNQTVDILRR